tara:strand:- start:620 stop:916 length:297 start_codon:yes stop_codon:yes gene_type:complete
LEGDFKRDSKSLFSYRSNNLSAKRFELGDNRYSKISVYYKNGVIKEEKNYKNGMLNGNLKHFWENGSIHTAGQYKNNKRIGIWSTYDRKGKLILTEKY